MGCTYRRGAILRFAILKRGRVSQWVGSGLSLLPRKSLNFCLQTVHSSAFFMHSACNSGMLSL